MFCVLKMSNEPYTNSDFLFSGARRNTPDKEMDTRVYGNPPKKKGL